MTTTPDENTVPGEVLDNSEAPKKKFPRPSKGTLIRFGLGAATAAALCGFLRSQKDNENDYEVSEPEGLPDPVDIDIVA